MRGWLPLKATADLCGTAIRRRDLHLVARSRMRRPARGQTVFTMEDEFNVDLLAIGAEGSDRIGAHGNAFGDGHGLIGRVPIFYIGHGWHAAIIGGKEDLDALVRRPGVHLGDFASCKGNATQMRRDVFGACESGVKDAIGTRV